MKTNLSIKQFAAAIGASVILVAGAAYAADNATFVDQEKQTDGPTQFAAVTPAAKSVQRTSSKSESTVESAPQRQRIDVSSPSYRKFIDDITERSGG